MERKHKFSIKKLSVGVVSVCIGFAWSTQTVQADGVAENPLSNQEHAKGVADLANESPQIPEVTTVVVRNQALPAESAEAKSYATNMADSVISENPENATFKLKASVEEAASPALVVSGEARELAEAPKPVSEPSDNALNETTRTDDKPRLRRTREVQNEESLESAVTKDVSEKDGEIAPVDDMAETAKSPKRQVRDLANRKERYQTVLDELKQQNKTTYDSLSLDEKDRISNALVTEFQDHFIENVLPGIKAVTDYKEISRDPNFKLGSPKYLEMIRTVRKEGVPPKDLIKTVNERLVAEYNRTLTSDITVDGYVIQNPDMMVDLVKSVMVGQNLDAIWSSKRPVLQGMYLLNMQYNFEENLPSKIVNQDRSMMLDTTIPKVSAFDNIKRIGNYEQTYLLKAKGDYAGLLLRYQDFFRTQIQPVIGGNSTLELVEKLAGQMSLDNYVQNRSKALMPESDLSKQEPRNTADLLHRLNLLIPVLSQGEGAVVGSTRDTVTLGIKAVYPDAPQRLSTGAQPDLPKMVQNLNQFENYNTFLREASRYGTDKSLKTAAPLIARDSLMTGRFVNGQDQRVWQSLATNDTVRNLIAPLKFDSPSYDVRSFIEGEKASQNLFNSFTIPLLDGSSRGPGLYSHEMTHANDQEVLFDKPYGKGGRREGQGPELYARGLFEARDNTQTSASGNVDPVFNLNTTIIPTNGKNDANIKQIQPSEALNTPQKLADYQHKLMKLIMWMEAKEAKVALEKLLPEQKLKYFNRVEQVDRAENNSTNDNFIQSTNAPSTLHELVEGSYVSAGFIQSGLSRFGEVKTNSYNFLPLLDSFYGANYAPEDKNTVGDLSFKRNAHEILGYQGYDAMISYLSDQFNSDQAFYTDLKRTFDAKGDALAGKTGVTPVETKVKQYQELLELELQNVPEELKTIYTDEAIEVAIREDLKVLNTKFNEGTSEAIKNSVISTNLKNVRNLKLNLLSRLIEESDTMNSDPTKQNLFKRTYTTRYHFVDEQRQPLEVLELNIPTDTVRQSVQAAPPTSSDTEVTVGSKTYTFVQWEKSQENTTNPAEVITTYTGIWSVTENTPTAYDIIYVSGTGTGNGETAQAPMANLNDAITKVRDGGTIRFVGDYSTRNVGEMTVNKTLTIDSQNGSILNLNEAITFNKPVTLTGDLNIYSIGNGNTSVPLIFNDTVIIGSNINTQNRNGTGTKPTVNVSGANAVISGGEFDKLNVTGNTTVTIKENARLIKGVEVPSSVGQMAREVSIRYETNQTTSFVAGSQVNTNLYFTQNPANVTLTNVNNVELANRSEVSLAPNSNIKGNVILSEGATLRAQDNSLSVTLLKGPGILTFNEPQTLTAVTVTDAKVDVLSLTGQYTDGKKYVITDQGDAVVTLRNIDTVLPKDTENDYSYVKPYSLYYDFVDSNGEPLEDPAFDRVRPQNQPLLTTIAPTDMPDMITDTVQYNGQTWEFVSWAQPEISDNGKLYEYKGTWRPQVVPPVDDTDANGIPDTIDTQLTEATRLVTEAEAKHTTATEKLTDVTADGLVTQSDVDAVTEANRQLAEAKEKAEAAVNKLPDTPEKAKEAKDALTARLTLLTAVEVSLVDDTDANGIPDTIDTQLTEATRLVTEAEAKYTTATEKLTDVTADGLVTQNDVDAIIEANRQLIAAKQTAQSAINQIPEMPQKAKEAKTVLNNRLTRLTAVEVPTEETVIVAYAFNHINGDINNFPTTIIVPANQEVAKGRQILAPTQFADQIVESVDQAGEWKFIGWSHPNQETVTEAITFIGKWEYKAYVSVPSPINYVRNDDLAVESPNVTTITGRQGKRSAFTNEIKVTVTPSTVQVGTMPKVHTVVDPIIPVRYIADEMKNANLKIELQPGSPGKTITKITYRLVDGKAVPNPPIETTEPAIPKVVSVGTKPKVEVKEVATIPVTYVRDDAKEANVKTEVNQGRPEKTTIRTTFEIVGDKAVPKITETTEEAIPKTISVGTKPLVTEEISKIRLTFVANEQDSAGHMVITDVGSQTRTKVTTPYKLVNGTAVLDDVNKQTVVYEGSPRIVTVGTKPVTTQISQDLAEKVVEDSNVLAGTPDKVTPGRPKLTEIRKTYTLNKDTGKVVEKVEEVIVDAGLAPERIVGTKSMVINPATDADNNEPTTTPVTVNVGETPDAEDTITNLDELPDGTTVDFKEPVDTSTVGDKDAVVIVTYPDDSSDEVPVTVTVVEATENFTIIIKVDSNESQVTEFEAITHSGFLQHLSALTEAKLAEGLKKGQVSFDGNTVTLEFSTAMTSDWVEDNAPGVISVDLTEDWIEDDYVTSNNEEAENFTIIIKVDGQEAQITEFEAITHSEFLKHLSALTEAKLAEGLKQGNFAFDGNIVTVDFTTPMTSEWVDDNAPEVISVDRTEEWIDDEYVNATNEAAENFTIIIKVDGQEVQVSEFEAITHSEFLKHLSALTEAKLSEGLSYLSADYDGNTVILNFETPASPTPDLSDNEGDGNDIGSTTGDTTTQDKEDDVVSQADRDTVKEITQIATNEVFQRRQSDASANYQAKLPETGEKSNVGILAGMSLLFVVGMLSKRNKKQD